MTYFLNSTEARTHARANLNIFDECVALMRAIIEASDNGHYEITVSNGTPMTTSTPSVSFTGTVSNPTITVGDTIILDNNTFVLGSSGTNLNAIISDINDAQISGITATKNTQNQLVINVKLSSSSWSSTMGSGTANTAIGLSPGSSSATAPSSTVYYDVWSGAVTSRKYEDEITRVRRYLENLGYTVVITKNNQTGRTFSWNIYW